MQICILDQKKITKLNLPNTIDGAFSMEYKPESAPVKKTINIEAQDGKWVFISNGEVNAYDNGFIVSAKEIMPYEYFQIKAANVKDDLLLFALPSIEDNCHKLTTGLDTITIGSDATDAIYYQNPFVQASHATIYKENENWYITTKALAYLNDMQFLKSPLKMGDIIFIYGLKIIWFKTFMYVYNGQNAVTITNICLNQYVEEPVDNTKYAPVTDEEERIELYNIDDYFFHKLRVKPKIKEKEIVIDAPPSRQTMQDTPLFIVMGGSAVMLASTFLSVTNILKALNDPTTKIGDLLPQIIMVAAMIFAMIFMPQITRLYQKNLMRIKEKYRKKEYSRYLQGKMAEIDSTIAEQCRILVETNPSIRDTYMLAFTSNRWAREIKETDFLTVRVGVGTVPAKLKIKPIDDNFTLEKDKLKDLAVEIANKQYYLENIPVTFSFLENRLTALVCEGLYRQEFIDGIILQLTTFHSAADLKLVFLLNDPNISRWDYIKFMPHCLGTHKDVRFFATNSKEIRDICSYLEMEFNYRREVTGNTSEDIHKSVSPYYLIITNDYFAVKNHPFIDNVLNSPNNLGYSLLIVEQSVQRVPNQCNMFLQISDQGGWILTKDSGEQIKFNVETTVGLDMRTAAIPLASVPLLPPGEEASLPKSLTFLEMYNVSKIEQLNVSNRWRANNPISSLQAPIGVQTNGEQFFLDLHEKYHGPHGLVAGTTGSGKSEFLITYLLSLSINYHPDEVQFVIIDYKGGGLAGAFENRSTGMKVPHLVGTITNLDVSEMNRTLVSINSEIKRRQQVFSEARDKLGEGTIDIYKYQQFYREGLVKEPMSHLMIVCDEFAELKSQQPDFMDELISIARIGRSLGIHLILATQKPSGVVTDQIWSNSKFKVCLKVQDRSDSMEMLKRPEAASLKEAGRFYLQIGYDEFFDIGQASWAGAKYIPTNKIVKKTDNSIVFVDNIGIPYKTVADEEKAEEKAVKVDQLTSIVKYLIEIAEKEGYQSKQLWRSAIPGDIFLNELKTKYNYQRKSYYINPIIGEYDNPRAQYQGALILDITKRGNVLIYGSAGSGKENLLSTIIYSVCADHHPSEVNFYIIDFGAETLLMYKSMPHIGDICLIDDNEKIKDLLILINKEMIRRKQLFVDYNGSYINYINNSGKTEPAIIVVINNYEALDENYSELIDTFTILFRDANKWGIYFVVTTSTENTMRTRTSETFNNKICLQMPGEDAYRSILNAPRSLKPLSIFGRGIVSLDDGQFEFQTAYITQPIEINNLVKQTIEAFKQYNYTAKKIPVLPSHVTLDYITDSIAGLDHVPVGINVQTKTACIHNFTKNKINVINAFDIEEHRNFLYGFLKILGSTTNVALRIVDVLSIIDESKLGLQVLKNNFDQVVTAIQKEIDNDANATNDFLYVIIGISELKNQLNEETQSTFDNIFNETKKYNKTYFIFIDNYAPYKDFQNNEYWCSQAIDKKSGIWLGYGVEEQYTIDFPDINIDDRKKKDPTSGFIASRSTATVFKKVVLTAEDQNE